MLVNHYGAPRRPRPPRASRRAARQPPPGGGGRPQTGNKQNTARPTARPPAPAPPNRLPPGERAHAARDGARQRRAHGRQHQGARRRRRRRRRPGGFAAAAAPSAARRPTEPAPPRPAAAPQRKLAELVAASVPGDVLVFHYSGHGVQVPCRTEDDGKDEALCPTDLSARRPGGGGAPHGRAPLAPELSSRRAAVCTPRPRARRAPPPAPPRPARRRDHRRRPAPHRAGHARGRELHDDRRLVRRGLMLTYSLVGIYPFFYLGWLAAFSCARTRLSVRWPPPARAAARARPHLHPPPAPAPPAATLARCWTTRRSW